VNNSSMAQIDPDTQFAGLSDPTDLQSIGTLLMAVDQLGNESVDGVVWDTAAGIEETLKDQILPQVLKRANKQKVKLIVMRPITTSAFTQQAAVSFALWAQERGIIVIFVRNLGQGRAQKYFLDWESDPDRLKLHPQPVEIILPDLGCWIADESTALGLSIADVALGNFGRLTPGARAVAERKFTPQVQLATADWLDSRRAEFEQAIAQAIAQANSHETTPPATPKKKNKEA